VIGTNPIRQDGTDKVTGRALFGADIRLSGMLYGAVLRSPYAHAYIKSIDTSQALALPGVHAVVTSADIEHVESRIRSLGEGSIDTHYQSDNILASEKVLYFGHAIAAVAATNQHIAEEALALIKVEYELLPPVLDVLQAMQPDAPILLDELRTDEYGKKGDQRTNIAAHEQFKLGDPESGFTRATLVVEREFHTAMVHQGYIEPQNATAHFNQDGRLTVWTSTQGAFGVRDQVAEILSIPVSSIRVIPMEIGGGFGGKISVYLEPVAALLSRKSGYRPVKLTMSRAEVLAATGPTSGSVIRVKMGVDQDGKICAAEAFLAYEAGAFPGSFYGAGMDVLFSPYDIPNVVIDGYDVVVNKPHVTAYRAPGGTNAAFAAESVIDEICQKLRLDPIQFRLNNAAKDGTRKADGGRYTRIGFIETLQAAQAHPHYSTPLEGANIGRGVACGYWGNFGGKSGASASYNPDGTFSLMVGSVDIGGSRTSMAIQFAEGMGVPVESVYPQVADTSQVGYTEGTYGSRTTFATGWAVYELSQIMRQALIDRVARLWDIPPAEIKYELGEFSQDGRSITLKQLAEELDETGGAVVASAAVNAEGWGAAFATHIVDVQVDPETGKVDILRYTAVQDVGKAIYPPYVEGQIQGGVAQGIGWGLNEEYLYDRDGRLVNTTWLDYRMPIALDLPMIDTVLVEVANPGHPYGVRGVGETPIVPPAGAVANAISRAIGVRLNTLPMNPGRILAALRENQG
jgi:CO/xanthine dehydrogenase Mo-binding subunit